MSADLFAAFGSVEEHQLNSHRPSNARNELASPSFNAPESLAVTQLSPETGSARGDYTPALFRKDGKTDILFDASDDFAGEEDDFGDFEHGVQEDTPVFVNISMAVGTESVSSRVQDSHNSTNVSQLPIDLLNLDEKQTHGVSTLEGKLSGPISDGRPGPRQSLRDQADDWDDFGDFEQERSNTTHQLGLEPVKDSRQPEILPADNLDSDWEPFEDLPLDLSRQKSYTADRDTRPVSATSAKAKVSPEEVRPTNIPPPAILLQILPKVYLRARNELTAKTSTEPLVANTIIVSYTVSARLVAGRALRRKRDPILAQSMRIGPASGKSSGMKLVSIDKSEALKEDQETEEAINAWSKHAHAFNAAVANAGIHRPLTALSTKMVPKPGPTGAVRAAHACGLCGMKRDERLANVDTDVQDSFGEFWTEHWGHTDCKTFWYEYQGLLDQR